MEAIVRTFIGKHIDLSKIVSISDAYFNNLMGSGGYYVGFEIHIQLLDAPIKYERKFSYHEYSYENGKMKVKMIDGRFEEPSSYGISSDYGDKRIMAVSNLQKQIDDLILDWKLFKSEQSN